MVNGHITTRPYIEKQYTGHVAYFYWLIIVTVAEGKASDCDAVKYSSSSITLSALLCQSQTLRHRTRADGGSSLVLVTHNPFLSCFLFNELLLTYRPQKKNYLN